MNKTIEGLIHHIELNNAGWRQQTARILTLSLFTDATTSLKEHQVVHHLKKTFALDFGKAYVAAQLEHLKAAGLLIIDSKDRFYLSESGLQEIRRSQKQAVELQARVQSRLLQITDELEISDVLTWDVVETDFLRPISANLGARVYELVRRPDANAQLMRQVPNIEGDWPPDVRERLALALERFVDPDDEDVRAYLLRVLNADLLVRASAMSEDELAALSLDEDNCIAMTVFVDTNLLFSLMGLHDNPADDSAEALVELVEQLRGRLDISFVALPSTVDEARRTLTSYSQRLSRISIPTSALHIAERQHVGLSGISLTYFRKAAVSGAGFTAEEYFNPYLRDFLEVMRSFGVELHDVDVSGLRTDQKVVDDILRQQQWQESRERPRLKSYEALEHDMILWHFVNRCRPPRVDSPLRAGSWIGTIDFRFISFDRYKQRVHGYGVPLCLHPATLLQMLQFWMPRSTDLDRALIQSIWPLLPHVFDRDAEAVTLKILAAISRYEQADDLSDETITRLLVSGGLRARISDSSSSEEDFEVVESEIASENLRLQKVLVDQETRLRRLESNLDEVQSGKIALEEKSEKVTTVLRDELKEITRELESEKQKRKAIEDEARELELRENRRRAQRRVFARIGLVFIIVAVSFGGMGFLFHRGVISVPLAPWLLASLMVVLGLWVPFEAGVSAGEKYPELEDAPFLGRLRGARMAFRFLGTMVGAAVIASAVESGFIRN